MQFLKIFVNFLFVKILDLYKIFMKALFVAEFYALIFF